MTRELADDDPECGSSVCMGTGREERNVKVLSNMMVDLPHYGSGADRSAKKLA